MLAYVDGKFVEEEDARISIFDRGFLFADGIYEVSAVIDGRLVDNDAHLQRLERSLAEIAMKLPMSVASLTEIQEELISRNGLVDGTVYLQVTRGAAQRNFNFPQSSLTLVMFTQKRDIVNLPEAQTGIQVISVPDLRWKRRDIKSVGLLAQVLAKQAAAEAGCQEALLVEDGVITEGASSSFFMVTSGNVVVTRPISSAILAGCTRNAVLALTQDSSLRIEERAIALEEAYQAKEAFITSASNFVIPVIRIDEREIGTGAVGPIAKSMREHYIRFARHPQPNA